MAHQLRGFGPSLKPANVHRARFKPRIDIEQRSWHARFVLSPRGLANEYVLRAQTTSIRSMSFRRNASQDLRMPQGLWS
jgi:hypothetical protein